ncbi:hypothetical protein [Bacillus wiedmannii]|uniref:hypothetical protein n=1 Tax=Bacillus wiedmannii TaxID=1890302 RepID=UPI0001A02B36|nr:hypothetical protein [Bacillus wiedmannii]EEK64375.1 hypothetical protein bcere0006_55130 [Bacillus wiedmannii]
MGYILSFGEGEYVDSYSIGAKEVSTTYKKEDAIAFEHKSEAEYVAELLGCKAISN